MNAIDIIPKEYVAQSWSKVDPFIRAAMAHAKGECEVSHLKLWCVSGQNTLMVFLEDNMIVGAVVYHFDDMPNDRAFYINAIGGKTTKEHTQAMFDWALSQGATCVRGCARESVARLWRMKYGFEEIYRMVEKRLC